MANPWDNDPIVDSGEQEPWANDPVVNGEARPVSRRQSFALGATDTFFGGFADEITGLAMGGAQAVANLPERIRGEPVNQTAGQAYDEYVGVARDAQQRGREAHPVTTFAGQLSGGAASTALGAGAAQAAAPQTASRFGSAMLSRPVTSGAAVGATEGAIYGAGSGTEGNRLESAAYGAVIGGPLGAAFPGAASAIQGSQRGVRQLVREGVDAARTARTPLPELDELYQATQRAYRAVDDSGVQYSSRTTGRLMQDIRSAVEEMQLDPDLHSRSMQFVDGTLARRLEGQPATLGELDRLRQVVRRDLVRSAEGGDRELGRRIVSQIDDMIDNATPEGRVQNAGRVIRTARQASRTQRAAEALEEAVESAVDRASSTGTGGNEQNAIRQNLRRLLTNEATARLYTNEQKALIRRAIRGDGIQNTLRILSGLSPDRGFLQLTAGLAAPAALGPVGIVAPAVGYGARKLAEGRQDALLNSIRRSVREGAPSSN